MNLIAKKDLTDEKNNFFIDENCFRSSRKSLDYTKQSLRISIDLGKKQEESETWLQVGRIYYLIHEDELADMYLQVRERHC